MQWSPNFLVTGPGWFCGGQFFHGLGEEGGFGMIQAHCICYASDRRQSSSGNASNGEWL